MSEPTTDTAALDELLVAYLDGELEEGARVEIEERLAASESCRKRLKELDATWELLDELPLTQADDDFSKSTIEMVAVAARDEVANLASSTGRRRLLWLLCGIAAVLLCGGFGYSVIAARLARPNNRLVEDLPVIENVDYYLQVSDIDFLRELAKLDMAPPVTELPVSLVAQSAKECRERLEGLDEVEKEVVNHKRERFSSLEEVEQKRIRALHESLSNADDAEVLRQTMVQYADWLTTLSPVQRAELAAADSDARIEKVKELLALGESSRLREIAHTRLEPSDTRVLFTWFAEYFDEHEGELLDLVSEETRAAVLQSKDDMRRRMLILKDLHMSGRQNELPRPSEAEFAGLYERLSERPREVLRSIDNPDQRLLVTQGWMRQAIFNRFTPNVSRDELKKFVAEKLDARHREYLDGLPPDRREQELRRIYFMHRYGSMVHRGGGPHGRGPGTGAGRRPGGPGGRRGPGGGQQDGPGGPRFEGNGGPKRDGDGPPFRGGGPKNGGHGFGPDPEPPTAGLPPNH
jgi:anti-sigma factor RsiW